MNFKGFKNEVREQFYNVQWSVECQWIATVVEYTWRWIGPPTSNGFIAVCDCQPWQLLEQWYSIDTTITLGCPTLPIWLCLVCSLPFMTVVVTTDFKFAVVFLKTGLWWTPLLLVSFFGIFEKYVCDSWVFSRYLFELVILWAEFLALELSVDTRGMLCFCQLQLWNELPWTKSSSIWRTAGLWTAGKAVTD